MTPPPGMVRHHHADEAPLDALVAEGTEGTLHFTVRRVHDRRFHQFQIYQHNFDVAFRVHEPAHQHHIQLLFDSYDAIYVALRHVHRFLVNEYRGTENFKYAEVQFTLMHRDLDPAINMPKMPLEDETAVYDLMYRLEEVNQSHKTMALDESLRVSVIVNTVPPLSSSEDEDNGDNSSTANEGPIGGRRLFLGPSFRDSEMKSGSRWMRVMPHFTTGPLVDCCFLTSLVAGYLYCKELKLNERRHKMGSTPVSDAWKVISRLNSQDKGKANKARERLYKETLDLCEEFGLDMALFRNIRHPEAVRREVVKLGVNVNVYDSNANYHLIFQHPLTPDLTKPTVSILIATNPITNVRHCGTILRPGKFFSAEGKQVCPQCHQSFYKRYFKYHVCARKKRCDMCKRRRLQPGEYTDHDIIKDCCLADIGSDREARRCQHCLRACFDDTCFQIHTKQCAKMDKCKDCGMVFRKNNKNYVHRCGDCWCPICKSYYNVMDGGHVCQLQPPAEQKKHAPTAMWDTETSVNKRGEHVVTAVAVSAEHRDKPGTYSMTTFYADEMQHPHDGWREEVDCEKNTYPEGRTANLIKMPKKVKEFVPGRFRSNMGGNNKPTEQEEEEAAVLGEALESSIQSRQVRAEDFFSTEAAEAAVSDISSDEEEEEEEEDGEGEETWGAKVADCMTTGAVGPSRPYWEGDEEVEEPSALRKFIEAFVNEQYYG